MNRDFLKPFQSFNLLYVMEGEPNGFSRISELERKDLSISALYRKAYITSRGLYSYSGEVVKRKKIYFSPDGEIGIHD